MDTALKESSQKFPDIEPFRITSPVNGEEFTRQSISISGRGGLPFFIHVRKIHPDGSQTLLGITYPAISPGGPWAIAPINFKGGPHTVIAVMIGIDGSEAPSEPITFSVKVPLGTPTIESPEPGAVENQQPVIKGSGGAVSMDVRVEVLLDLTDTAVGDGTVYQQGGWSANIHTKLEPGTATITARQSLDGRYSERSRPLTFKVRPPTLDVRVTPQPNERVKFSGAGHTGATVEITKVTGPGEAVLPPIEVENGTWELIATNWPPGDYTLSAIQKVSDNTGGWIPSLPYEFTFRWELSSPTDVVYTKDYTPVFSGKGYTGATVYLLNPGGGSAAAPQVVVVNGAWSSRALQVWGPTFERAVQVQQRFNGLSSLPWVEIKVTIPPLAPVISNLVENGLSPTISGTCWPGAVVNLVYSDSPTVHKPSGSSGSWTFRRDIPFAAEVPHTVTVTQTAATLTSPPTARTFTVHTSLHQPVITEPRKDEEVGRDPIIRGTAGVKGATMKLRDAQFGRPLGEPELLTSDGDWSIELKGLAFRKYTLDAGQSIGSRESLRSEYCFFEVVVLPPKIEVPASGGDLPRTSRISGTGLPGARVEVWLQGNAQPLLRDMPVDADGRWEGNVTLPIGAKTIWARQTFGSERPSKDSPRLTYNVVPAAPFIETPTEGERVGRQVVVSGFGYLGDTVAVAFADAPQTVLGQAPVLLDRTWSVAVTLDRAGGAQRLIAVQSRDGFKSTRSPERPVLLGSYLPTIDKPEQGRWVTDPVVFAGQGQVGWGAVVAWFNPELALVDGIKIAGTDWQAATERELRAGGNWVRFAQIAEGSLVFSDWAESERFEVGPQQPLSD